MSTRHPSPDTYRCSELDALEILRAGAAALEGALVARRRERALSAVACCVAGTIGYAGFGVVGIAVMLGAVLLWHALGDLDDTPAAARHYRAAVEMLRDATRVVDGRPATEALRKGLVDAEALPLLVGVPRLRRLVRAAYDELRIALAVAAVPALPELAVERACPLLEQLTITVARTSSRPR